MNYLQCIASLWIEIRGHSTAAASVEKYKVATARKALKFE